MKKANFFPKESTIKPSREEQWLIEIYRKKYFEIIKNDLGEGYNDTDAEIVFNNLIQKLKSEGVFKEMLDKYTQEKINRERRKYMGQTK